MKVAVVGSRNLTVSHLEDYLPENVDEIISGGARGIDQCAADYAVRAGIKLTVIQPDYGAYGKKAPLVRNLEIIRQADLVMAFWDGQSRGTKFVIDNCRKMDTPVRIFSKSENAR